MSFIDSFIIGAAYRDWFAQDITQFENSRSNNCYTRGYCAGTRFESALFGAFGTKQFIGLTIYDADYVASSM